MAGYSASFTPGGGLHPILHLSVPSAPAPAPSCALHALVAVPPELIADRYQLSQLERDGRLGSAGIGGQAVWHAGEGDLEAPAWCAGPASVLVRLSNGGAGERDGHGADKTAEKERDQVIEVDVPLHLRYQEPVERRWLAGGARADPRLVVVEVPWVFWACAAACLRLASSSSSTCPPSRPPPLVLVAPTGVLTDLPLVEGVTAAAVWACFAFLCWTAVRAYRRGAVAGQVRKDKAA
ncbi:uncharacterized protein RHOBADRAFT_52690 [Rhodotorula graminis WP1]|uniref:Protein PBN1 n=1 Tax=Rhodotorula graminis (strain WP1) TaxID=578459 RepID=A0A194S556_RHOGW|nr:uncharacterized protein RHOBADRAFT_52690 [Rhodotorula graminis WP1]KPV75645.1 hypothetical protein RHOBADRAFT_52690 [Rhodotorula graminis WP1]